MRNFSGTVYKDLSKEERDALFFDICEAVVDNNTSFKQELEKRHVSLSVFNKIVLSDPTFAELYRATREVRCDYLFEEIIEIADTPIVGDELTEESDETGKIIKVIKKRGDLWRHRQMKIDARKWAVARINPAKYGDKIDITSENKAISQVVMFEIPSDGRNATEEND